MAPASAIAASTISASSSSESCGGQVGLDQLRLEPLGRRLLGAVAAAVGLRGLEPLLALALEHRDLVAGAELGVLLQGVDDQAQRGGALALARLHRGADVGLDTFENGLAHRLKL